MWSKLKTWQKVLAVFGVLLLVGLFLPNPEAPSTEANNTQPEATEEQKEGLANRVESKYKEAMAIDSYTSYLLDENTSDTDLTGYITSMEDVSKDTVRVHIQTDADKEEAEGLARQILVTVGFDIEDLNWVVVRGVDGLDRQVSRSSIPALR